MKAVHVISMIAMVLAVAGHGAAESNDQLLKIPDGYVDGLAEAKYGTYGSIVNHDARSLQARLTHLENKVMGLSALAKENPIQQSEILFILETAVLRLHMDINATKNTLAEFDFNSLNYGSVRLYQSLRFHGERLFEDMVRFIDIKLPGPNGLQFRSELKETLESIYLPNYRRADDLSDQERSKLYQEKLDEFKKSGGSLDEMKPLTKKLLAGLGPYTRVEYVVRADGEIWITEGSAGHILLAAGGAVKSGGQMILVKNPAGEFTMLVVSNSSGSFKPDVLNARETAERLRKMLKLQDWQVVVTKGEPVSLQGVKVYSKGMAIEKSLTTSRLTRLKSIEKNLILRGQKLQVFRMCRDLFK